MGRVAENACRGSDRIQMMRSGLGRWLRPWEENDSQKTSALINKKANSWSILIFLGLLFIWQMVSDHLFSGCSNDLPARFTSDFFKLLSLEVLGRKEIATFVCLESEKEANQAAGRSRFCSITIYREENKEPYNLFKHKTGKWMF